jgi:hypothetical protein
VPSVAPPPAGPPLGPPVIPPGRPPSTRLPIVVALLVAGLSLVGLVVALVASLLTNAQLRAENERLGGWDDGPWVDEEYVPVDEAAPLLEDGDAETVEIDDGWGAYRLELAADQVVRVQVEPLDGARAPFVELTDDVGDIVAYLDGWESPGPGDDGAVVLWHWAEQAGTYGVYTGADGDDGALRLTVERHAVEDAEVVLVETAAFTPDGPLPTFAFTGDVGQLVRVRVTTEHPDHLDPILTVRGPDGEVVVEDDDGGGYPDPRAVFAVATAGEHRVEVEPLFETPPPERAGFTIEVAVAELP